MVQLPFSIMTVGITEILSQKYVLTKRFHHKTKDTIKRYSAKTRKLVNVLILNHIIYWRKIKTEYSNKFAIPFTFHEAIREE
jgi:hypothetical protein